ncbi:hypothetical protein AGR1A_pAt10001 [Agrobacterium fabacearum CFBP 5771]|nr:hypothetical protein AGR1A_pAt10001 [Agrobacterium fabacearum CFBP 5771]
MASYPWSVHIYCMCFKLNDNYRMWMRLAYTRQDSLNANGDRQYHAQVRRLKQYIVLPHLTVLSWLIR